MSQGALFIPNASGAAVRSGMNDAFTRLSTRASGISRPVDIGVFEEWIETDNPGAGIVSVWQWDGVVDLLRGVINTVTHTFTPYMPTQLQTVNDQSGASTGYVRTAIGNIVVAKTGDLLSTYAPAPASGWIRHNDGTIGGIGSGASTRAQADTQPLFRIFWSFGDAVCPLNGTRGATADADFAAGRTVRLPLLVGRVNGVAGSGTGLTARPIGTTAGAESIVHFIRIEESVFTFGDSTLSTGTGGNVLGIAVNGGIQPMILSAMQPTGFTFWDIKL